MENSQIWNIINRYFEDNPQCLVRHHIESYNDFFKNGIFQIFKEKNPLRIQTQYDEEIDDYRHQCIMYFGGKEGNKIYFGKPVIYDDNNSHYMYPNEARLRNMTYGMTIHYDIEVEFIKHLRPGEQPNVPGLEAIEGGFKDSKKFQNFKNKTFAELEEEKEMEMELNKKQRGGYEKEMEKELEGGTGPPKRRKQKKIDTELTAAETALFREAIEKSMIAPNIQMETIILEKILLGKFPIMLQSNYCILSGLPREIRHTMGECRNDIGGYFIIDGKEKTVISQEKFGYNTINVREIKDDVLLYAADITSVSENVSKPIRSLSIRIMAPTPSFTYKNIVVKIPNVRAPIPLFILFRALGVISDKQIITMCLLDLEKYESLIDLFEPSVHDAGGIMNQRNALKFIANLTKTKTTENALEILSDYFLPHVGELNFIQKAYFLGYMVKHLLSVYAGIEQPTDRDNFKFKRIELVGSLINDLFREYYTIQLRQIHLLFEEKITYNRGIYEDNLKGLIYENYKEIFRERVVESGFKKAFKGNWGAQSHTKRIGVVQDLNRLSHNSMLSHLRKTNLPLDSSVKLVGPRVLHNTQWGFFDPIDTPDGANIGIHKHLSISAYITQGYSRELIIKWLREKVDMKLIEDCSPIILSRMTKIFVNGLWAGVIDIPVETVEKIRLFRRNGLIPTYTSVNFDINQNAIFIYTDAGRICRPIFYKDTETGKFSFDVENIKQRIEEGNFTWNDLITGFNKKTKTGINLSTIYELHELYENIDSESNPAKLKRFLEEKAIIDYIDTNESEGAMIAFRNTIDTISNENGEHSKENKKEKGKYTHMEIHESLIFGTMANLINFPENNPATRNSFSCGQSKQACSLYHTNHQVRMDKTAVVLMNGQIPLVKTRYLDHINNEENTYGENTIVAIMCYTGYNVEDAVLINEGSLKRGLFRTTYYTTYESHEEKSKIGNSTTDKVFTNIENEANVTGTKPGYDYSKLDKYGLIRENTPVDDKTVLIGLTSIGSENKTIRLDESKVPKKGQLGVVDKSFITDGEEGFRIAKIRIREERIPTLGDKMASRSGQKGTVGLVIPEQDMPFTKDGIRPDLIINPHAIPTRMTIGQLVESITGKACVCYGGFGDCTAFNNDGSKIKIFGEMLVDAGYHSSGNEVLYNGQTGEQIETEIFMGPTYYMRLKHMVKDKINYRASGPRTALTRQPVSGRANDGGLRIGEMERDSVISHGISEFLRESMMERGDKYQMAICNNTGTIAIYNQSKNLFMSPLADGPIKFVGSLDSKDTRIENVTKFGRNFSIVSIPYSMKLLIQELQTMNVQMRLITEDNIEQLENLSYSKNIEKLLAVDKLDPKTIINAINHKLILSTKTKDNNEFSIVESNVISESPEYVPESPEYAPESPEQLPELPPNWIREYNQKYNTYFYFNQVTGESQWEIPVDNTVLPKNWIRKFNDKYKTYYYFNEITGESQWEIPTEKSSPEFVPTSTENPPPSNSRSEKLLSVAPSSAPVSMSSLDLLTQKAQEYNVGDKVHYNGDSIPLRIWNVKSIGDRTITIETDNFDNLDPTESIKVVTANDIYPNDDYSSPMYQSTSNIQTGGYPIHHLGGGGGGYESQQPYSNPINPIHFAPVFKIMNGGNDFSTDTRKLDNDIPETNNNFFQKQNENSIQTGGSENIENKPVEKQGLASKMLNFSNFLIKKLE
jgi:DNA-directed RNA polymerase II subunit RPB2